jgi:hypothetical protein
MQKVKAILNPGYKESDALLYDVPGSHDNASAGAAIDPAAENNATTQPIQDSKVNHSRYDSGVGAADPYSQQAVNAGHPAEQSHLGQDAALGAGALGATGLAAHEHDRATGTHVNQAHSQLQTNPQVASNDYATAGSAVPSSGYQTSGTAPVDTTGHSHDHHYGRDAALGAGAVGAAEAAHHHHKHEEQEDVAEEGQDKKPGLLKRIFKRGDKDDVDDAAIAGTGAHESGKLHKNPPGHGHHDNHQDLAATQNTSGGIVSQEQTKDHHYGRDAALGAGALGAGAAAAHHHQNQHHDIASNQPATGGVVPPEQTSQQHHHHHHHDGNQNVAAQNTASGNIPHGQTQDHHYGRDAAIGAGVVGTGAAAQHHHHHHDGQQHAAATQTGSDPAQHHYGRDAALGAGALGAGAGLHHHHEKKEAEKAALANQSAQSTAGVGPAQTHHTTGTGHGDHHYGRDAALGAGALGAGEAAHHHHESQKEQEFLDDDTQKERKPSILKRIFKRGDKDTVESDQAVEEGLDQHDYHLGHDPALGTRAVGADEPISHHHDNYKTDVSGETGKDHHYARDAALGAGALGAGEAVHHHHDKQRADVVGTTERDHHHGRDAAVGAGALGAGETAHHHHDKHRTDVAGETGKDHHYGRDAALGVGALGAGEAAHHHHEKQKEQEALVDDDTQKERKPSILKRIFKRGDKDTDQSEETFEEEHDHHHGRDAAIGAGAVGTGLAATHHHNEKKQKEIEELGVPADQKLHTHPDVHNSGHAIRSQILNPDGHKVDHVRFGTTASTQPPVSQEPNVHSTQHGASQVGQSAHTEQAHHGHLGRDAAIGAGAVGATGLAAHEHNKHKAQDTLLAERAATTGDSLPQVQDDGGKFMDTSDFSKGTTTGARVDPAVAAAQKAYKDHDAVGDEKSPISPTSTTSVDSGPASKTQGPHKSNILNILDPRVRPDFQQLKADKEARTASVDDQSSPANTTATAAAGATTQPSNLDTPKASGLEHSTATTVPASHNAAATSAPIDNSASTGLSSTAPQQHGIVTGERGVTGDTGNPYSSKPLDPRVNMPGSYPAGTPTQ